MTQLQTIYCLDANVLIEAWNKYYSPTFCHSYWQVINDLGRQGRIFIPRLVRDEITRTDDDLARWVQEAHIPVKEITMPVTECLGIIYSTDPRHERLVDTAKGRSLADPWVIAHAMHEKAVVVTKEELITNPASQHIRIPNVCVNMGVSWMNDFDFIRSCNISFTCAVTTA